MFSNLKTKISTKNVKLVFVQVLKNYPILLISEIHIAIRCQLFHSLSIFNVNNVFTNSILGFFPKIFYKLVYKFVLKLVALHKNLFCQKIYTGNGAYCCYKNVFATSILNFNEKFQLWILRGVIRVYEFLHRYLYYYVLLQIV